MSKVQAFSAGSFFRNAIPRTLPSFWWGQFIAMGCVGASTAIRVALSPYLEGVPFISFFPALIVASLWGGASAGITTLVLTSTLASSFWLFEYPSIEVWRSSTLALVLFIMFGGALIAIVHMVHVLIGELASARRQADLIAGEMKHRIGNVVQIVQAISRFTAKGVTDVDQYEKVLSERLRALGLAQQLFTGGSQAMIDVKTLLDAQLEPFDRKRIFLSGPPASVPFDLGGMLGLVIFELATNAVKYGSLSEPQGKVVIEWAEANDRLVLKWQELGGPPVSEPVRKGFGTSVIKSAFPHSRGSTVVEFLPQGVQCILELKTLDTEQVEHGTEHYPVTGTAG